MSLFPFLSRDFRCRRVRVAIAPRVGGGGSLPSSVVGTVRIDNCTQVGASSHLSQH
jgi:hypothetical protein